MIALQNCNDAITKKFDPAPKNEKKTLLYAFLFFVGYSRR